MQIYWKTVFLQLVMDIFYIKEYATTESNLFYPLDIAQQFC